MQIKIFNIPIPDGEKAETEMNAFLRGNRVLKTEGQIVTNNNGSFWSYSIRYMEGRQPPADKKPKKDYSEILDEKSYQRFSKMRDTRKVLAQEEGIPAYAIFTNEELAKLAKLENLTLANMKKVKGIGEKKVEKYGQHFVPSNSSSTATAITPRKGASVELEFDGTMAKNDKSQ